MSLYRPKIGKIVMHECKQRQAQLCNFQCSAKAHERCMKMSFFDLRMEIGNVGWLELNVTLEITCCPQEQETLRNISCLQNSADESIDSGLFLIFLLLAMVSRSH